MSFSLAQREEDWLRVLEPGVLEPGIFGATLVAGQTLAIAAPSEVSPTVMGLMTEGSYLAAVGGCFDSRLCHGQAGLHSLVWEEGGRKAESPHPYSFPSSCSPHPHLILHLS